MEFEKLKKIIFRPTDPYQKNRVGQGETKIFLRLASVGYLNPCCTYPLSQIAYSSLLEYCDEYHGLLFQSYKNIRLMVLIS